MHIINGSYSPYSMLARELAQMALKKTEGINQYRCTKEDATTLSNVVDEVAALTPVSQRQAIQEFKTMVEKAQEQLVNSEYWKDRSDLHQFVAMKAILSTVKNGAGVSFATIAVKAFEMLLPTSKCIDPREYKHSAELGRITTTHLGQAENSSFATAAKARVTKTLADHENDWNQISDTYRDFLFSEAGRSLPQPQAPPKQHPGASGTWC